MHRRALNGTSLRPREWVRYWPGAEGIELLEASFEQHVYERHIHDTFAIGVTRCGIQRFWCCGATHESGPGHVIVIPPGEAHDGESGTECGYTYRMFYVSIGRMAELASDAFNRPASSVELRDSCLLRDAALAHTLNAAWTAMTTQPTSLATDELFAEVVARLDVRYGHRARVRSFDERGLRRVREYLREHLHEHVRLDDLAAMASLSRFQLTRQFERAYGLPLHAYHVHLRLSEAKKRLRAGLPIATVAADLGFADQSHLNRRFKGAFGMTPGEWRDSHRRHRTHL
jgi:AraC-like DNA-binding protein